MANELLSPRLKCIQSLVSKDYDHIWDCCCDHGKLGLSLHANKYAPNIHLVDLVPELIERLTTKLSYESHKECRATAHCLDASQLPLDKYEGQHLVIIAGVGGDLAKHILRRLDQAFPRLAIDYLLCPIRQLYTLRSELNKKCFAEKDEKLVEDKGRYYEVMLVTNRQNNADMRPPVSRVGNRIWNTSTPQEQAVAKAYMQELLTHYTRMQNSNNPEAEAILRAYRDLAQNRLPL